MFIDTRTQFCSQNALTTGALGTSVLGAVIDLKHSGLDIGHGQPLYLVIEMASSATSLGAATVSFSLVSDSTAALATDGSATVHMTTGALSLSKLASGKTVAVVAVPSGSYERYLGLLQTVGTAALTGGAVNAFLTADVPSSL